MSDKIIKKITINIAGTDVEVTPQQAKNLHEALGDLLGLNKPAYNVAPIVIRDRPIWPYPTITWTSNGTSGHSPYIDRWQVNYNGNSVKMAIQ